MSLVLQSSGGGSVTIAEPTTASNFTQNLPAADGTVITTGNIPAGSVLQVVQATSTAVDSTSSTGFVATSLSLSITPASASSKILLISTATVGMSTANVGKLAFARNGTLINNGPQSWGASYFISTGSFSNSGFPWSETYLDSPATTSATTYAVHFGVDSGGPVRFNSRGTTDNAGLSVLIAMEIAG
jgi:hypothetical protein